MRLHPGWRRLAARVLRTMHRVGWRNVRPVDLVGVIVNRAGAAGPGERPSPDAARYVCSPWPWLSLGNVGSLPATVRPPQPWVERMACTCVFLPGCGGLGVRYCDGCGGDQCICCCGGELDCDGCELCQPTREEDLAEGVEAFEGADAPPEDAKPSERPGWEPRASTLAKMRIAAAHGTIAGLAVESSLDTEWAKKWTKKGGAR